MTKANTAHISACRKAYQSHLETCGKCSDTPEPGTPYLCPVGLAALDELCSAITANPDCQHITIEDVPCTK